MIEIEPIKTTIKGYSHSTDLSKIKIGAIVRHFSQTFKIRYLEGKIFIGTSNYTGASKNNKAGSSVKGEHNLIFISPDEVWRTPIGKGGEARQFFINPRAYGKYKIEKDILNV